MIEIQNVDAVQVLTLSSGSVNAQDVELLYVAGGALANSRVWPEWSSGSEFGPIRAQSIAERR